ncbi:EpsG family protein [Shewanella sp. HL-SH2]|uniref:EpsG family protein n=1 Tax=Shewanella sp. HL-SH2 TaxID=3436238 RepID=UPI003EB781A9
MKIAKLTNYTLVFILCIFVSYISASRNLQANIKNDTQNYNNYYSCIAEAHNNFCNYEIGAPPNEVLLYFVIKLQSFVLFDFQFFIFAISLFFVFSLFYFYRSITTWVLPCFFILIFYPMFVEALTNTIRQSLCIGLSFLMLGHYIKNMYMCRNKMIVFYFVFFSLMLFSHSMGIIIFMSFIFSHILFKANKWWVYYLAVIFGVVISFFMGSVLSSLPLNGLLFNKIVYYINSGISFNQFISLFGKVQFLSVVILLIIYTSLNRSLMSDEKLRFVFCYFISLLSVAFALSSMEVAYRLLIVPFIIYPVLLIYPIARRYDLIMIPFILYFSVQLIFFVSNTNYIFRPFY